jgi:spore germination protein KC
VLLVTSGCWDRKELNEVSFVTGMALEKGEKYQYFLTVEVINAEEFGGETTQGNTGTIRYTMEGDLIAELNDKMNVGLTRDLNFSHTRVIVIDETLAREGIGSFLQFLERSAEFRNDFHLVISRGIKASDIIGTTYPIHRIPSLKMDEQFQSMEKEWGGYPDVRLTDFTSNITSDGRHPVAAAITIQGSPEKGDDVDNNKQADLDAIVVLNGLSVFKDDKLIGFLDVEQARDYLWTQDLKKTTFTAKTPDGNFFAVRFFNSHTNIQTSYENNRPQITIELVLEGDLIATQSKVPIDKLTRFKELEEEAQKEVERKIKGTITHVQEEYGVDIFGFGETMYRQHYQQFKPIKDYWDEEFKKAEINVNAKVFLRRDGIRSRSFLEEMK